MLLLWLPWLTVEQQRTMLSVEAVLEGFWQNLAFYSAAACLCRVHSTPVALRLRPTS